MCEFWDNPSIEEFIQDDPISDARDFLANFAEDMHLAQAEHDMGYLPDATEIEKMKEAIEVLEDADRDDEIPWECDMEYIEEVERSFGISHGVLIEKVQEVCLFLSSGSFISKGQDVISFFKIPFAKLILNAAFYPQDRFLPGKVLVMGKGGYNASYYSSIFELFIWRKTVPLWKQEFFINDSLAEEVSLPLAA